MKLAMIGCAVMLVLPCAAQNVSGSISGNVQDTTGQVVPDAAVTISNRATRASMKVTTDERGDFTVNGLQPESYSLQIVNRGSSSSSNRMSS